MLFKSKMIRALYFEGKKEILENTVLNVSSTALYYFAQWLTTVLAVRLASFEMAGVYALAIGFSNFFYSLAIFGLRGYQISDVENRYSREQYFAARLLTALFSLVCFLIVIVFSNFSLYTIGCYTVYMFFKLGEAYSDGYFSVLQKEKLYRTLAFSYSLKAVFPTIAFAVALSLTHNIFVGICALTVAYYLIIFFVDISNDNNPPPKKPYYSGSMEIIKKCVPLMLFSLSIPIMNYITRETIARTMSDYYVGQYASLSSVIVVLSTLATSVFVVFIPQISLWYCKKNQREIVSYILKMSIAMVAVSVAAILVGKFLGIPVCRLIFGEEILESIGLLIPLIVCSSILMIKSFFSSVLVAIDHRGVLLTGEVCGVVLCAVAAKQLTELNGMYGANLSYVIGVVLQLTILCIDTAITIGKMKKYCES